MDDVLELVKYFRSDDPNPGYIPAWKLSFLENPAVNSVLEGGANNYHWQMP